MIKLRSRRFCRSNSKLSNGGVKGGQKGNNGGGQTAGEIKWELRPGGMLVQKREAGESVGEGIITIKVSTVSHWHAISIEATSTIGELKTMLSPVTGLEPREQRVLYRGKEKEDGEYLHIVGVRDKEKVILLQDPAIKESKLRSFHGTTPPNDCTIIV
ncbi:hypothetical protein Nepgr_008648 [Nepenthes gracilis]|uniref:Ubiquitin-like domain-containing protein n=1 Tax=Nepenthes gracilis TaxID=150966 RepID=A0AAD3XJG3_NEPGR|nr:hypothetical protein Nepgr_008648 [Nepenthes gracilis]